MTFDQAEALGRHRTIEMDAARVLERVRAIAETFAADRPKRQERRFLAPADFAALSEGFLHPPWGLTYDLLFSTRSNDATD